MAKQTKTVKTETRRTEKLKKILFILELSIVLIFELIKLAKENRKDDLKRKGLSGDVRKF